MNRQIPLHDYSPALRGAVSWLGDRYLLAEPVTRRVEERKAFFNEAPRWHPALFGTPIRQADFRKR